MEIWGGILSGPEIAKQVEDGGIVVDPFERKHINPASIDLTLGRQVKFYDQYVHEGAHSAYLDSKKENPYSEVEFPDEGHILRPGQLYLMHTVERVHTVKFVPVIDGKSSIGRLGVQIHITAGYGDPGFDGQYTLEVVCVQPVKLYPGMKIAQMRFHTLVGKSLSYKKTGHYKGKKGAQGAVTSMSYKQFGENDEKRK